MIYCNSAYEKAAKIIEEAQRRVAEQIDELAESKRALEAKISTTTAHTYEGDSYASIECIRDAIVSTNLPEFLGWREIANCRAVCRHLRRDLDSDHYWKLMCLDLAHQHGLYAPTKHTLKWRKMFHDHLWISRAKWTDKSDSGTGGPNAAQDFTVSVAARLRPGRTSNRNSFFVPLHQRLRLLKKGEKLTFAAGEAGLDSAAINKMVGEGSSLSPDIIRALLDAQRMEQAAGKATAEASGQRLHWNGEAGHSSSHNGDDDSGQLAGMADDVNAVGAGTNGAGAGAGAAQLREANGKPVARGSKQGAEQERSHHQEPSRRGGNAKVFHTTKRCLGRTPVPTTLFGAHTCLGRTPVPTTSA